MFTDNPLRDFHRHDEEQDLQLERLPRCGYCDGIIQDEFLYDIDGEVICDSCLKEHFRKHTDDYIE